MLSREEYEQYEKWGVTPPVTQAHGTEKDALKNMTRLMPRKWRQEGNWLIGDTEVGELRQKIPTNYFLVGTGKDGLPKLKKHDIQKT